MPEAVGQAEETTAEDKPEVFEFTLPRLEDLDSDGSVDGDAASGDALEVLGFDEDSVSFDADEESSDLSGPQDTHDARLDLAVAYEAMGDIDGAVEILEEVIASGKSAQITEAKRLKQKWQNG